MIAAKKFSHSVLTWFDQYGRTHLPWQQNITPYRVWISEIMLQQTQVATVIPYFECFMQKFPTLLDLANADEDRVLHRWAGLGYYSRARNLLRAAKMVIENFAGNFPDNYADLVSLPGIGKSTAGAILAIAFQQRVAILDGNVKRVIARFLGYDEAINTSSAEKKLWEAADFYTPATRVAHYTQAMMDLGATICTRANPLCDRCPLHNDCVARSKNITHLIPHKKSKSKIPTRVATFLILQHKQELLLEKRKYNAVWKGLWSFPEIVGCLENSKAHEKKSLENINLTSLIFEKFQIIADKFTALPKFKHIFSHYCLEIHPVIISLNSKPSKLMAADEQIWYNLQQPQAIGLPKPIQTLIRRLHDTAY